MWHHKIRKPELKTAQNIVSHHKFIIHHYTVSSKQRSHNKAYIAYRGAKKRGGCKDHLAKKRCEPYNEMPRHVTGLRRPHKDDLCVSYEGFLYNLPGPHMSTMSRHAMSSFEIPVEIFVTKSEASGPLQNGFWLPFCAKFWPWVLPSCKWTPPWYRNFALEVRVCYPPVPTILSESGGLINNHYKLDGFKA